MEEQRQRQEDEQRRALAESDPNAAATAAAVAAAAGGTGTATASDATVLAAVEPNTEEAMLQRALALSTETPVKRTRVRTLFAFFFQTQYEMHSIRIDLAFIY